MKNSFDQPIIFFDGYCNLCNSSVDWIMKRDKKRVFKFASLQGKTAQQIDGIHSLNIDSVVYYHEGTAITHFKAIGAICKHLPFPYNMGMVLQFFPPFIYNWIAKNRFKWFGKKETCRMPTQEERARFLD